MRRFRWRKDEAFSHISTWVWAFVKFSIPVWVLLLGARGPRCQCLVLNNNDVYEILRHFPCSKRRQQQRRIACLAAETECCMREEEGFQKNTHHNSFVFHSSRRNSCNRHHINFHSGFFPLSRFSHILFPIFPGSTIVQFNIFLPF